MNPGRTLPHRHMARIGATIALVLCLLAGGATWVPAQGITDADIRNLGNETPERNRTDEKSTRSPGALLAQTIGALALVLGLIGVVAWLAKRYMPGAGGAGGVRGDAIRVLSTRILGNRRSLMLVRVRGQTLLLGVTPQSITTLTEIDEVEGEWAQPADAQGGGSSSSFDRRLGRMIQHEVAGDDVERDTTAP